MKFLHILQIVAIVLWAHAGCIWLQLLAKSYAQNSNEEVIEANDDYPYEADYCCYVGFFGRHNIEDPDPEAQRYNMAFRALEEKAENCKSLLAPSEARRRGLDKIVEFFQATNTRCSIKHYVEKFIKFLDMTKAIRKTGDVTIRRLRPPTKMGMILSELFDNDDDPDQPITYETLDKIGFNFNVHARKKFYRHA